MKYIKQYDDVENIKPYDYVIFDYDINTELGDFLKNTIGQVRNYGFYDDIPVDYENVPDNLKGFFNYTFGVYIKFLPKHKIIYSSSNKKDVQNFLAAKKYNL